VTRNRAETQPGNRGEVDRKKRIAIIAAFASGWLFRDPTSGPVWQIGLALVLALVGVFRLYLHET